jgi:hypothetical protein
MGKNKFLFGFFALALLASPASAQVRQQGTVTGGHVPMWIAPGIIGDGGAAAAGLVTSLGVTNNGGPGICLNSAVTSGPYNQICLAATTNGGTKISSYAINGATTPGLSFDINGSVQGFPAVTGLPTTINGVVCFADTLGTTKNCSPGASALTKTDDTNVTITLSGTPATALLQPTSLTMGWAGTLAVTRGGTGLGSGTSGGIPYFNTTTTIASSGVLTANQLVLGGGAGIAPATLGSLGTTTTVLHGNAGGAPSFGAIVLTTDVSGALPIANGGTSQTSAATARAASGLNVESLHTTGDTTVNIASTTRVEATSATLTASRAWTLPAASSLNPGQTLAIADIFGGINGANTIAVTRAGSDTISGANTATMATQYQVLVLVSDGVSKWSFVTTGGGAIPIDVQVFTTTGANTWTRPAGVTLVRVIICAAGGGGGGGGRAAAATSTTGGGGGGGGHCHDVVYKAADAGASQTVTIATGGTNGAGATVNGNAGTNGSAGGNSTFGSLLTAYGGGGGQGGPGASGQAGGGGGGSGSVVGGVGAAGQGGDSGYGQSIQPGPSPTQNSCAGGSGPTTTAITLRGAAGCSFGGAGGSWASSSAANIVTVNAAGGHASAHGPGGGGGGSVFTDNTGRAGGSGGGSIGCPTPTSGGAAGNNPGGSTAADFNYHPGCGGGGGGSATATGGGAGGNGTSAGGGGGGGAGDAVNGGAGGSGGNGLAIITSW